MTEGAQQGGPATATAEVQPLDATATALVAVADRVIIDPSQREAAAQLIRLAHAAGRAEHGVEKVLVALARNQEREVVLSSLSDPQILNLVDRAHRKGMADAADELRTVIREHAESGRAAAAQHIERALDRVVALDAAFPAPAEEG